MTREHLFDVWAPPSGAWSAWVKPVLFAHMRGAVRADAPPLPMGFTLDWLSRDREGTMLVINLPGPLGVFLGLQLALERGYRPVPLYNACPGPQRVDGPLTQHDMGAILSRDSALDVFPIMEAIDNGTAALERLNLPDDAPPAFLLDCDRRTGSPPFHPLPGKFDNRWVSLPTDFPSGNLLLSRGYKRTIVIQASLLPPQEDLAHTLLRWQEAGMIIESSGLDQPGSMPEVIQVARPGFFRLVWHRMLATAGVRRNPLGGFGGVLPVPSSS